MLTEDIKNSIKSHALEKAPEECCGLIFDDGVKMNSFKCKNDAQNPLVNFSINPIDYLKCSYRGNIVATYHSHKNNDMFSYLDKENSINHRLDYVMYNIKSNSFHHYDYKKNKIFYLNIPFQVGKNDCFTLVRNYMKENLSVELPEEVIRAYKKGSEKKDLQKSIDLIEKVSLDYDERKFFKVKIENKSDLKENDIVVLGLKGKPMHLGVFLGNGLILHHPRNKFATSEQVNEKFFNRLLYVYRIKKI
tara:strand:- start:221 stop:964 length:744 start_codon:yes stop_codon:yes gene_type:complete